MNQNTPQSLLSLPPHLKVPDAYRVLGLSRFESDRATIKAAADQWIARLSEARTSCDEASWSTAMQWVKNAYSILGDTGKKAAYDRKLALESEKLRAADPLAGLLPQGPSLPQTGLPSSTRLQAGHLNRPHKPTQESIPATAMPELVQPEKPTIAVPVIRQRPSKPLRRGIPWLSIFASVFCIAAIAGIGGLLYVLSNSDKQIVLNLGDGPIVVGAGSNQSGQSVIAPGEIPDRPKKPFDPVMGGLGNDMPVPRASELIEEAPGLEWPSAIEEPERPTMQDSTVAEPTLNVSIEPTAEPSTAEPAMETPVVTPEVTDSENAESEKVVNSLVSAIKQHDWDGMQAISEKLETLPMFDPLRQRANAISQLVDLATYYRGGIQNGLSTLQAGTEFDLTADLKVVIVEVAGDKLIIRFNGKNKEYTFDAIPLNLAHKLAEVSVKGDEATIRAAKYAFQAIAPIATPPYRDAAIAELEKITEEVEGAEPAKLVAAIRDIYQQ